MTSALPHDISLATVRRAVEVDTLKSLPLAQQLPWGSVHTKASCHTATPLGKCPYKSQLSHSNSPGEVSIQKSAVTQQLPWGSVHTKVSCHTATPLGKCPYKSQLSHSNSPGEVSIQKSAVTQQHSPGEVSIQKSAVTQQLPWGSVHTKVSCHTATCQVLLCFLCHLGLKLTDSKQRIPQEPS